jgi:predicted nucleic acid-binding protein
MVHLLDVNLLIALAWPNHVHHTSARAWFSTHAALTGHQQVTDAYLIGLALRNGGALATFDAGLAAPLPANRRHAVVTVPS